MNDDIIPGTKTVFLKIHTIVENFFFIYSFILLWV